MFHRRRRFQSLSQRPRVSRGHETNNTHTVRAIFSSRTNDQKIYRPGPEEVFVAIEFLKFNGTKHLSVIKFFFFFHVRFKTPIKNTFWREKKTLFYGTLVCLFVFFYDNHYLLFVKENVLFFFYYYYFEVHTTVWLDHYIRRHKV